MPVTNPKELTVAMVASEVVHVPPVSDAESAVVNVVHTLRVPVREGVGLTVTVNVLVHPVEGMSKVITDVPGEIPVTIPTSPRNRV